MAEIATSLARRQIGPRRDSRRVVNVLSQKLHAGKSAMEDRLACGKKMTLAYRTPLSGEDLSIFARCKHCWAEGDISEAGSVTQTDSD